jgi:hypothetical protein
MGRMCLIRNPSLPVTQTRALTFIFQSLYDVGADPMNEQHSERRHRLGLVSIVIIIFPPWIEKTRHRLLDKPMMRKQAREDRLSEDSDSDNVRGHSCGQYFVGEIVTESELESFISNLHYDCPHASGLSFNRRMSP